jgi:methylenetetrahydrofolate reductase (NADPH)
MTPGVSFELFPPRTPEAQTHLWSALEQLAPLAPDFTSVTCGAGGSAPEATLDTLREVAGRSGLRTAGHLTCVGRSRAEVDAVIRDYWGLGVRHIVALRGDMPDLGAPFTPHPDGYEGSLELIRAIRAFAPFEVSVAAYPEPHPDSRSLTSDLEVLARKADAGAARAITQFCFVTEAVVRLRDNAARFGIEIPIVPGIMLSSNFAAVARMARRCGATVPGLLSARFEGLDDDPHTRKLIAAIVAARQVEELRREGFEQFHFYTLNQADIVGAICRLLDVRPAVPEPSVTDTRGQAQEILL